MKAPSFSEGGVAGFPKRRSRYLDAAVVVMFGAFTTAFWVFRILRPARHVGLGPTNGDAFTQIYPMSFRAARFWLEGVVPLWNPFQIAGQPFLATQQYGVFYPLHLPYLCMDTASAIELVAGLHVFLSACLGYFCFHALGLGRLSAFVGAFAFSFSGYAVWRAVWYPTVWAACAWLPLGILGVKKLSENRGLRAVALVGIALGMSLLATHAQFSLYVTYGILWFAIWEVGAGHGLREYWPRFLVFLLGGAALGLSLAAVQWLPTLELLTEASRDVGPLPSHRRLAFEYAPVSFLRLALRTTPGIPVNPYVGVTVFFLASLGCLARRLRRLSLCFAILAVLSVCFSFGSHTPLFEWYSSIAPLGSFRNEPRRLLLLYAFSVAVLVALALEELREGRGWRLAVKVSVAAFAVALLRSWARPFDTAFFVFLGAAGLLSMVCATVREKRVRQACVLGLAVLACTELFRGSEERWVHPIHRPDLFHQEGRLLEWFRDRGAFHRSYFSWGYRLPVSLTPKQGTLRGIHSLTDYEPLTLRRYGDVFALLDETDPTARAMFVFDGRLQLDPESPYLHLLDLFSVKFVAVPLREAGRFRARLTETAGWSEATDAPSSSQVVFERKNPLPRAYMVFSWKAFDTKEKAFAALRDEHFDPWREAILEVGGSRIPEPGKQPGRSLVPAAIASYRPTEVRIETSTPRAGLLVLTDAYYPGWQARVDGEPAEILRANYVFRGVFVPAGSHEVVFRYEPLSFRIGLGVSGASLVVLVGLVVMAFRKPAQRSA